ncbi:hypothetical protein K2173_015502 [Erythroxylum novogranatense]|uniref:Uncharacterized protein n=1 Tax=Erythroxylum novogranatense TaxID=1862640 RepID=A0AAV8SRW5_9ROSI|nr:hypothetical protein K2173_015502 [Erythroxylum novogranatense]
MEAWKPILTLVGERLKLLKDGNDELVDATKFRRLIESLRYLTVTRPNIVYRVRIVNIQIAIGQEILRNGITSSYLFHLSSEAFSWLSKKQKVVALSMAKSEYITISNYAT